LWPALRRLVADKITGRLGGRLHMGVCGGAALPIDVDRFFSYLGLPLFQGYGLTESSPVISVNRPGGNRIGSIGVPLENVQVRLSEEGELQAKSDSNMLGYWRNEEATREMFTDDGWLRSGDLARRDKQGYLYIIGRSKEIVVLSNGEKVPPADMEIAITLDPLFDQAMIIGEGRPALTAVIQLNRDVWAEIAGEYNVEPDDESAFKRSDVKRRLLERAGAMLKEFPGYAQLRNAYFTLEPWTVEDDLLTPTLKLKRGKLFEMYKDEIDALYN
jgi:long-chain acyl-CoA synthetase